MEVEKTLKPGRDGTKRFVERFGKRLVAVRQRIDREAGMRYTTVELVVDQRPTSLHIAPTTPPDEIPLRIAYKEEALRQQVRSAGGRWDSGKRVWWLPADIAHRLGLMNRRA